MQGRLAGEFSVGLRELRHAAGARVTGMWCGEIWAFVLREGWLVKGKSTKECATSQYVLTLQSTPPT